MKAVKDDFSYNECPICKKKFYILYVPNYAWKFERKCFCSYTCMRKAEKKSEEKSKYKNSITRF